MIVSLFEKRTRCSTEAQRRRLLASSQAAAFRCPPTLTFTHLAAAQLRDSTRCLQPLCYLWLCSSLMQTLPCPSLGMGGRKVGMCEPPHPSERAHANSTSMQNSPDCSVCAQVIPPTSATSHEHAFRASVRVTGRALPS